MCADNNHVRTWTVTRFRGMISTQPGSTPLASFKILSLEETESHGSYGSGNDIGEREFRRKDQKEIVEGKIDYWEGKIDAFIRWKRETRCRFGIGISSNGWILSPHSNLVDSTYTMCRFEYVCYQL